MVGLAGEGQNFDGNGPYVRFQPGGGDQTLSHSASRARHRATSSFGQRDRAAARHAARATRASARRTSPTSPCYKNAAARTSTAPPTAAARRAAGATTRAERVR